MSSPVPLEYESEKWGIGRIVIDGIQNHLPGDSGGSNVEVRFYTDTKEFLLQHCNEKNGPFSYIVIEDDGKGYDYRLLGKLYSTKKENGKAVGEHGEGLKMIIAACLREGIPITLRSRDWKATPHVEEEEIDGHTISNVIFEIETGLPYMEGSQTIFSNPPDELALYFIKIAPADILLLRPDYKPIYSGEHGSIVDEKNDVFIKGVRITSGLSDRLLFSYDINARSPRDRDHIEQGEMENHIGDILRECDNPEIIRKVIEAGIIDERENTQYRYVPLEFQAISYKKRSGGFMCKRVRAENAELWKTVFHQLYGEKAVIYSSEESKKMAEVLGYKVVKINLADFLESCGINKDKNVASDDSGFNAFLFSDEDFDSSKIQTKLLDASHTSQYRAGKWNSYRILADSIANHIPEDSGGTKIEIEYLVKSAQNGYNWISRGALRYETVEGIRITDNGKGYDSENLVLLLSSKTGGSVGQFGEGIPMISTACLRKNMKIKFRSKGWVAAPLHADISVDGKKTRRLHYKLVEGMPGKEGSVTTITGIDEDMVKYLKKIDYYILHFRGDFRPLHSASAGEIFDDSENEKYQIDAFLDGKKIFNKGFYVRDRSHKLLFDYNFRFDNISPDRDMVDGNDVRESVTSILKNCDNKKIITRIIKAAEKEYEGNYAEFIDTELNVHIAEVWKECFYDLYGKNTVLSTGNPHIAAEAIHRGFTPLKINENIRKILHRAGVETDLEVVNEGIETVEVNPDDITPEERKVLDYIPLIEQALKLPHHEEVKIFESAISRAGRKLDFLGFYSPSEDSINLRRSVLSNLNSLADVYDHERGHKETGCSDASDGFRGFFESYTLKFVLDQIARIKENPDLVPDLKDLIEMKDNQRIKLLEEMIVGKDEENEGLRGRIRKLEEALSRKESFENKQSRIRRITGWELLIRNLGFQPTNPDVLEGLEGILDDDTHTGVIIYLGEPSEGRVHVEWEMPGNRMIIGGNYYIGTNAKVYTFPMKVEANTTLYAPSDFSLDVYSDDPGESFEMLYETLLKRRNFGRWIIRNEKHTHHLTVRNGGVELEGTDKSDVLTEARKEIRRLERRLRKPIRKLEKGVKLADAIAERRGHQEVLESLREELSRNKVKLLNGVHYTIRESSESIRRKGGRNFCLAAKYPHTRGELNPLKRTAKT